jgi:hypothetical protein
MNSFLTYLNNKKINPYLNLKENITLTKKK